MFVLPGRPLYSGFPYVAARKLVGLMLTPVPPMARPPAPVRPVPVDVGVPVKLMPPPENVLPPPENVLPPPEKDDPPPEKELPPPPKLDPPPPKLEPPPPKPWPPPPPPPTPPPPPPTPWPNEFAERPRPTAAHRKTIRRMGHLRESTLSSINPRTGRRDTGFLLYRPDRLYGLISISGMRGL